MTIVTVKGEATTPGVVAVPPGRYVAVRCQGRLRTAAHRSRRQSVALLAKRVIDIVVATIALVLVAPLMVAIAIAICVQSRGAPLFAQERVGRGGRSFRCWKFRSMYRDAEEILASDPDLYDRYVANDFKLNCEDDPRVTSIGRVLRTTSLDELPQLFNVLRGQMSLVGPRPVVPREVDHCYGPWAGEYLAVRPGLTGPWQVSGRNDIRYPERAVLDAHYVSTWTLRRDLAILLRTPVVLIRKAGVI